MFPAGLETSRLYLRRLTENEVTPNYVSWLNDKEVNRYLESRFRHYSREDLTRFIRNISNEKHSAFFGMFLKKNDKHIGNIKIDEIHEYHLRGTIGLLLGDKSEWGKGYATEAIAAVTQYGFDQLKLVKVCAGCYESNIGSKIAFEKVGYKAEGFLRNQVETGSGREGLWQLGILPDELQL